ncbi:hypothetical protein RCA23_c07550 [Planktomarina temperata RCA23]|uniref:Uncharacterized protein n=1 Tax=Planktomarina temperata RCA23 TaxID=666509 RepID=A0AAN0RHP7_9RHOB|nr:hypothetical protein RCA23_c07550 [Planktomarina temperata RCA23]
MRHTLNSGKKVGKTIGQISTTIFPSALDTVSLTKSVLAMFKVS